MSKARRTVLSGVVTAPVAAPVAAAPAVADRRTIQQTLYLPPAVHDQLRELAFAERVKMHAVVMEGLDMVFKARGAKSIADLTKE